MRHGLTGRGRYLVVRTRIPDRPGELIKLLQLCAEQRANVVSVEHHREGMHISVAETEVELTVATRNVEHAPRSIAAFEATGIRPSAVRMRRERKVVTVLFADLVGFTARAESLDPEDVEAILRPYHERLALELEQRGGTVEKFVGDAVMAVFGAPVAHEDDPERAVRAALAIRDGIARRRKARGAHRVNTGEALVTVDADRTRGGDGRGDVVNTASRLQSAAPSNGILVGESTYRATAAPIEYREHEPVEAKGKASRCRCGRPCEARCARVGVELRARRRRSSAAARARTARRRVRARPRASARRSS
jgi:class 3 adenylate cyclase